MANICNNKFYLYSEHNFKNYVKKIDDTIKEYFDGEITYYSADGNEDSGCIEGWFESKWAFPEDIIEPLLEDSPEKDKVYFRCLSEEYGNGYVAMNIYDNGYWHDGQYFDL